MNITIAGHQRAAEILEAEQLDVIFISSPETVYAVDGSDKIEGLAKTCCKLLFNDVIATRKEMSPPQKEDIEKALEYAKGKDRILICCQAGISRSSAIAYLIATQELGAIEALNILEPHHHFPNNSIIKLGADILNLPNMVSIINQWKLENHC